MKSPKCIICSHFSKAGSYLRFNDIIKHLIEYCCLLNVLSFVIIKFNRTEENLSFRHLTFTENDSYILNISDVASNLMRSELLVRFNDVVGLL